MDIAFASQTMSTMLAMLLLLLTGFLLLLRRYWVRSTLQDIRGPPSSSFLLGNETDIKYQEQVGQAEQQWTKAYGTAWRIRGCIGSEILMLTDPKAIQHVAHTSAYLYPRHVLIRTFTRLVAGHGLFWVEGHDHRRQRKIMNPAFATCQLQTYLPVFSRWAGHMTQKCKERLAESTDTTPLVDVTSLASKAALDILCEVAFDYRIGALDNQHSELLESLDSIVVDASTRLPKSALVLQGLLACLPEPCLRLVDYIPTRQTERCRTFTRRAHQVVRQVLSDHQVVHASGKPSHGRDVLSMLVAANASEDRQSRLNEEEVISQMTTLMLAGSETTAATLSFLLLELARHPHDQETIREEIKGVRAKVASRGDTDMSISDLESMQHLNAAIKEALRLHPIVPTLFRKAAQDDVIPLSIPITTGSGQMISKIPVRGGQEVRIFIAGYNRLPQVWGEDAENWNPGRFLNKAHAKYSSVGLFANLLTFSAGVMSCIGWRFALIELQVLVVELLENFVFSPPDSDIEIISVPGATMEPAVRGKEGVQLPLRISLVR